MIDFEGYWLRIYVAWTNYRAVINSSRWSGLDDGNNFFCLDSRSKYGHPRTDVNR